MSGLSRTSVKKLLELKRLQPGARLMSRRGNIYKDGAPCLDDPPPTVAMGKNRELINQVVSMFDREHGWGEDRGRSVTKRGGKLHRGNSAGATEPLGSNNLNNFHCCNDIPIATITFNDYYYGCHKTETGGSPIKIRAERSRTDLQRSSPVKHHAYIYEIAVMWIINKKNSELPCDYQITLTMVTFGQNLFIDYLWITNSSFLSK